VVSDGIFRELGEELLYERRDWTLLLIMTHFSVSGDFGASPSQTGVFISGWFWKILVSLPTIFATVRVFIVGRVAQSVSRLATGWTVRGSNPGGRARFSALVQTGPGTHPASCTMGTGSFPGVKSDRGVRLTPHPLLVPLVMKE